ncbi:DUF7133 domain-containing protein [Rubripirellula tenax]|nr:hypothetical protein [Rubripirellula tenax]
MLKRTQLFVMTSVLATMMVSVVAAEEEPDYYRIVSVATSQTNSDSRAANWRPGDDGPALEISGIAPYDDDRIAVAIRKGEVWILSGIYDDPPAQMKYHRFASALHEPLGLLRRDGDLLTVQRSELTRLRDTNADDVADEYLTVTKGWGVTGHYHEYAYGPKVDGDGNLWLTLNIGMGLKGNLLNRTRKSTLGYQQGLWRGWGMKVGKADELIPVCAGMRSPSGLGANADGDMFYTDQQGNWVATGSLHHMREGAFFHHPESLASMDAVGSTIHDVTEIPDAMPLPEALARFPQMKPPAVWFPYKKMGQSTTDIMLDASDGKFGPFAGQLFIGEFTQAGINRVFLEKVDGEYQGACFPFRSGLASAVLRLMQGKDGSVFAGLTNRGWSSLGTASYGLQRLIWTGKMPFEIQTMRVRPNGFDLTFTRQVDTLSASDPTSYQFQRYTYNYHSTYGSDEIQRRDLTVRSATVQADGVTVRLVVDGLTPHFVHELNASGVRDQAGKSLLHSHAYYTLNRLPTLQTGKK